MRIIFSTTLALFLLSNCSQRSPIVLKQYEEIHTSINDLIAAKGDSIFISINNGDNARKMNAKFEDIEELVLNCGKAFNIPSTISKFKKLETLVLTGGNFNTQTIEISKLPRLQTLVLLISPIKELPIEIYEMKSLKNLSLLFNKNFQFQKKLCEINFSIKLIKYSSESEIPDCLTNSGKIKIIPNPPSSSQY